MNRPVSVPFEDGMIATTGIGVVQRRVMSESVCCARTWRRVRIHDNLKSALDDGVAIDLHTRLRSRDLTFVSRSVDVDDERVNNGFEKSAQLKKKAISVLKFQKLLITMLPLAGSSIVLGSEPLVEKLLNRLVGRS